MKTLGRAFLVRPGTTMGRVAAVLGSGAIGAFGFLGLVTMTAAAHAQAAQPPLLISGARVLDDSGQRWLEGQAVLVVGDRIEQVAKETDIKLPESVQRIDGAGLSLIPGLMDLHT